MLEREALRGAAARPAGQAESSGAGAMRSGATGGRRVLEESAWAEQTREVRLARAAAGQAAAERQPVVFRVTAEGRAVAGRRTVCPRGKPETH